MNRTLFSTTGKAHHRPEASAQKRCKHDPLSQTTLGNLSLLHGYRLLSTAESSPYLC